MGSANITLRSVVVSFGNIIKGDTVIIDREAIGHRKEISTDPTNGQCSNKSKPFDRADGEPLYVTEGD